MDDFDYWSEHMEDVVKKRKDREEEAYLNERTKEFLQELCSKLMDVNLSHNAPLIFEEDSVDAYFHWADYGRDVFRLEILDLLNGYNLMTPELFNKVKDYEDKHD